MEICELSYKEFRIIYFSELQEHTGKQNKENNA